MAFIDLNYTISFWKGFFGSFLKSFKSPSAPPPQPKPDPAPTSPSPAVVVPTAQIQTVNTFQIFDPELIITDEEFTKSNAMSESEIQSFLELKGSFLKDYKINEHKTSYWIYKHCSDNGLNPKVLLTHIQKEQGTITMKTFPKTKRRLDYFCGVGAYDPPRGDDPKWSGVDKQILGAVTVSIKRYKQALGLTFPYAYITDKPESRKINIKNAATRSLYFYTPFIGDETQFIGKNKYEKPFANHLFWYVYSKWFAPKN